MEEATCCAGVGLSLQIVAAGEQESLKTIYFVSEDLDDLMKIHQLLCSCPHSI